MSIQSSCVRRRGINFVLMFLVLFVPARGLAEFLGCSPSAGGFGPCDYEVDIGGGSTRLVKYWRNHSLTATNHAITRAVVAVHGTVGSSPADNDAAENQLTLMRNAAVTEGVEPSTLIVAPFFPKNNNANQCPVAAGWTHCNTSDCLCWNASTPQKRSWKFGGVASNGNDRVSTSSFAVVDAIVEHFANSGHFPNLTDIVVIGHSAGGQFTMRYAAANQADLPDDVRMRYMPCNPGTYMFLNALRPTDHTIDHFPDYTTGTTDLNAWRRASYGFTIPTPACPNSWPPNYDRHNDYLWGLDRLDGEATSSRYHMHYFHDLDLGDSATIAELVRRQFLEREIVLMHGEDDSAYEVGADVSECPNKAQGTNRLMRGAIVFNHVCANYDCKNLGFAVVEDTAHSSNQMYNSQYGRKVVLHNFKPPSIGHQSPLSTERGWSMEIGIDDLSRTYPAGSQIYTPTGSRSHYTATRDSITGVLRIIPDPGYEGVLKVPVHVEVPLPDHGVGTAPRDDRPNRVLHSNNYSLHVNVGMNWLPAAVNNPALF